MQYKEHEDVIVYVNTVGPYSNPQETYEFYKKLPFCAPAKLVQGRMEGLGEALQGYELIRSNLKPTFMTPQAEEVFCLHEYLTQEHMMKFFKAIKQQYFFELFIDDLPIWGHVGEMIEDKAYVYTHWGFSLAYNGNRIVEAKLTTSRPELVKTGNRLAFTYSVAWTQSDVKFSNRFDSYLDNQFFGHQIHWFSIFNSLMMVVFLVGLVSVILMRILQKDCAAAEQDDEETGDLGSFDVGSETGWKFIHGDVFRAPPHLTVFSALVGTGSQLAALVLLVIALAIGFYQQRGSVVTALIVCYALTSIIGGYVSGSTYVKNGGKKWIRTMVVTASLLPGAASILSLLLNIVGWSYGSTSAIPFATLFVILLLWLIISMPLTFAGTVVGRHWGGTPNFPCRISPVPSAIPEKKWYFKRPYLVILGGIMPFGSIFMEMFFVFTALWQHKYYHVFGFLFIVYAILVVVSSCVAIVSTYILLNGHDYRWHWMSFLNGASTGVYAFFYATYYFLLRTKMTGFLQFSFYFGHSTLYCTCLGLVCGAVSFLSSQLFVHTIYRYIKAD
jgi:transmembrane 9 superfamily protein 3